MRRQSNRRSAELKRLERDGPGRGRAYGPWLTVRTVHSRGQSNRVLGRASGREHHLLSALECDCLYLLDWNPAVVDIREQFALVPLRETLDIAESLGVRHPTVPGTRDPAVMTTDFVITVRDPYGTHDEALAVKQSADLESPRVLEKLEIERRYWQARRTPWAVVTERELPRDVVKNVRWAAALRDLTNFALPPERVAPMLAQIAGRLTAPGAGPLGPTCLEIDDALGLSLGTSLALVRHALATKRFVVDMAVRIDPDRPLQGLRVVAPPDGAAPCGGGGTLEST